MLTQLTHVTTSDSAQRQRQLDTYHAGREDRDEGTKTDGHIQHQEDKDEGQRQLYTFHTRREDKDEGTETAVHTPHQERTKMREQRQLYTHHTRRGQR